VKESDRLAVMAEGLGRLGITHELQPDGIRIAGGQRFGGGTVESHGDHRIAMAFTVASLVADGEIRVRDVANVGTSFPGFITIARQAGIDVEPA
jgi:5-enolpyruvylshikimate-3-phosphate synthase